MDITELREKINAVDKLLLTCFLDRMRLSEQIAEYKRAHNLPILDPARESEVLRSIGELSGEYRDYAQKLFKALIELSKARQCELYPVAPDSGVERIYGLIGRTLSHSFSQAIHRELGNAEYRLIELEPDELDVFFKNNTIAGLNVTIPYKRDVIKYCAALSDEARVIGSVNTLVPGAGGLHGHNTDAYGFAYMARRAGLTFAGKKVLIFGSGGASLTARYVAEREGAERVVVISRSGEDHYGNLERHSDAEILINTTPVGMFPRAGQAVVDLTCFPRCRGVLDMVYNPANTALLMQAEALGIPNTNGLSMLAAQAKAAAELFEKRDIPESEIERIIQGLCKEKENIVLIGMPGSGKTTVGRALARLTGRELIDLDQEIARATGITITEIFERQGEAAFRRLETQQAALRGAESGKIIVTGGGIVKAAENYPHLRQNGRTYHITRPVEMLSREGRPLSQGDLEALHRERRPLYESFRDAAVENTGTPEETAALIWREFCEHTRH